MHANADRYIGGPNRKLKQTGTLLSTHSKLASHNSLTHESIKTCLSTFYFIKGCRQTGRGYAIKFGHCHCDLDRVWN